MSRSCVPPLLLATALAAGCSVDVPLGGLTGEGFALTPGGERGSALGVASDELGNVYVSGNFRNTIDLGAGPLVAESEGPDMFIASYDPAGTLRWAERYSGARWTQSGQQIFRGELYTVGHFSGVMLTALGNLDTTFQDTVLFRHSAAGALGAGDSWGNQPGTSGNVQGKVIDASPSGRWIAIGGNYIGNVDFGPGPIGPEAGPDDDGFVVVFDQTTNTAVAARDLVADDLFVRAVAVRDDGSVTACGLFCGNTSFGGGGPANGAYDGVCAGFDASLTEVWSQRFSTAGGDIIHGVASAGTDHIVVGSQAESAVSGACGTARALTATPYLARLDASGNPVWEVTPASEGGAAVEDVVQGPDGLFYIVGTFNGRLQLGDRSFRSRGGEDGFVAILDDAGTILESARFGGEGDERTAEITVPTPRTVAVVGSFSGSARFGTSTAESSNFAPYVYRYTFP
ncbi:MAG: hypothetical protein AAGF12_29820 [Myxococcota bacterium]